MREAWGVELGNYKHAVGSLHLYDTDQAKAKQFLREGWQSTMCMPVMPPGDPWPNIAKLLTAEADIRRGKEVQVTKLSLPDYWADLLRLLQVYKSTGKKRAIVKIKGQMVSDVYDTYIEKRVGMSVRRGKAS